MTARASACSRVSGKNVFHTYSTYARGIEVVNGTYAFLDSLPRGRDEKKPQA